MLLRFIASGDFFFYFNKKDRVTVKCESICLSYERKILCTLTQEELFHESDCVRRSKVYNPLKIEELEKLKWLAHFVLRSTIYIKLQLQFSNNFFLVFS